jgi:hypothetical protein
MTEALKRILTGDAKPPEGAHEASKKKGCVIE